MAKPKHILSEEFFNEILGILQQRFQENMPRHKDLKWENIEKKLIGNPEKLKTIYEMEKSGGEPDVITFEKNCSSYFFVDCSAESPVGRRSLCYDYEAQISRKEHQPKDNAIDFAKKIGVDILNEMQYRQLQTFGKFDTKTSSWIKTPENIRKLGGALFADYRYENVFVYHNGAQSYYAARGFRGIVEV